ncbi:hypothetical protein M422DRAFT_266418 [Sphaerobolus stellatus SS14]|uniref:DUF1014-domain-containing protein n=1 Tax=Sphaerobolus stellatus (strain SS14) TaxID=990650 RepID=A0A0C9V2R5_SPHS4|nr:hypothetical protein M422DRAFT_266418 [Sphaerobolus stellatus SS14]
MPPAKGGNSKKEAGRARKAEAENKKKEAVVAVQEKKESEEWSKGAKASKAKEDKEAKKAAEAARKAENARLLAEEEAAAPAKVKAAPKAGAKKKAPVPAGPGAIAAGGGLASVVAKKEEPEEEGKVESFQATGIDDALDLLSIVNAKADKASVGQQAAGLERHPERRFKAAFEAYQERELPIYRKEHPGLRLQQYKELLYKQFQKSPENPFNQVTVSYDASKEERVEALHKKKEDVEKRLREE